MSILEDIDWPLTGIGLFFVAVLSLFAWALIEANAREKDFVQRCEQAGGTISKLRRDHLCLSSDGRVMGFL